MAVLSWSTSVGAARCGQWQRTSRLRADVAVERGERKWLPMTTLKVVVAGGTVCPYSPLRKPPREENLSVINQLGEMNWV